MTCTEWEKATGVTLLISDGGWYPDFTVTTRDLFAVPSPLTSHPLSMAEQTVLALSMLTPPQSHEEVVLAPNLPWQQVFQVAQHGQLLPLLGWKSIHRDALPSFVRHHFDSWPPAVHQELQRHYRQNWLRQEHQTLQWHRVQDMLHRQSVPYSLYKGFGYAQTWYPDPAMRAMKDIDIVIPHHAQIQVGRGLSALGLQAHQLNPPHPCATSYSHPQHPFHLDVHHRISWPHHTRIPEHTLLENLQTTSQGLPVFGATQQFLFHTYHACKEQWLPQHTPLRAFLELRELYLQLHDSPLSVQERAARWGMSHILDCGLAWLQHIFPGLLPPHRMSRLSPLYQLSRLIRYPEQSPWPISPTLHTCLRGLFLTLMIDHTIDRINYGWQRLRLLL